ncbi:hypothetical protein HUJ05_007872 [Dendroctonus ponderosae]|nr:hypothetical protein HUJ05_007872 [Dendroctonus ponderosae]
MQFVIIVLLFSAKALAQFPNGRSLEGPVPEMCAQRTIHETSPLGQNYFYQWRGIVDILSLIENGCDRPDLLPVEVNGWFWTAIFQKLAPTTDRESNDWSFTGGNEVQQPDNREFALKGKPENCLAILNNRYNDGIHWHDEVCSRRRPFICEDSEELLRYVKYIRPDLNTN